MHVRPTIIVDTREQEPYSFDEHLADVFRAALPAGDYSLAGMETEIAVERKSLNDFVSTVIHGRQRFHRELKKLADYNSACVVVEGSLADILARRYAGGAHPNSVVGSIISIIVDYGVPVFFCCSRPMARLFTQAYLLRFHEKEGRL